MFKSVLRIATASMLMSTALYASAGETAYQDIEVTGVMQEVVSPSLRCPSKLGGTIAGYGDSALLGGRVVFLSSDCFSQTGTSFTFTDGRFMITTMTGELLFASYSGQAIPTGEGTLAVFNGATFTITGGTGKYDKATGGGDLNGTEDLLTARGTLKLTGRILLKKADATTKTK
jgi:hypothetical protein